jgi:hypothetical protein
MKGISFDFFFFFLLFSFKQNEARNTPDEKFIKDDSIFELYFFFCHYIQPIQYQVCSFVRVISSVKLQSLTGIVTSRSLRYQGKLSFLLLFKVDVSAESNGEEETANKILYFLFKVFSKLEEKVLSA